MKFYIIRHGQTNWNKVRNLKTDLGIGKKLKI